MDVYRFVSDYMIKHVLHFLTGTRAGCNQVSFEIPCFARC